MKINRFWKETIEINNGFSKAIYYATLFFHMKQKVFEKKRFKIKGQFSKSN